MLICYIYLGKYFVIRFTPAFINKQHFLYIFNSQFRYFGFCSGKSRYRGKIDPGYGMAVFWTCLHQRNMYHISATSKLPRSIYAAKKSLGLVFLQKLRASAKFTKEKLVQFGSILKYMCSNALVTRKGSAFLHGNKFVFLTEWFSAESSSDVTVMSTRFLHVGATKNVKKKNLPHFM